MFIIFVAGVIVGMAVMSALTMAGSGDSGMHIGVEPCPVCGARHAEAPPKRATCRGDCAQGRNCTCGGVRA